MSNCESLKSVTQRVRIFDNPFAYICLYSKVNHYCSYCLRIPENKKLFVCANCEYARYCDKNCQRLGWKFHKNECRRLKKVFPNLPLTEVLFLSRIIDRVLALEQFGDRYGWERDRKWSELLGHQEDIKNDKEKYQHYLKIVDKMSTFRKEEMIEEKKFYEIFCKTSINSHSIHTMAGDEIGMALDLGISAYDHSCRPNCTLVFDGFHACLRPLIPEVDASDPTVARISYVDVGRSRYQRREDLKGKWYFVCECERCNDAEDDILTSLRCKNQQCDEPLITREDSETCAITCTKCSTVADEEYVGNGQKMMRKLPPRFSPNEGVEKLQILLKEVEVILHPKNIYLTRLQTAIMSMCKTLKDSLPFLQKQVYENYKRCFPKTDRHIGYQLIHLAKAHIEKGERNEALPYAFEAMNIFEVCFGLEHPYYLQTLALWTYLDTNAEKTTEELLALTSFTTNRPVDLSKVLTIIPTQNIQ